MILVLIRSYNASHSLALVMASAGLLFPSIHLISMIFLGLYNRLKHMTSTIRYFYFVLPNFTKHFYQDLKLVQIIIDSKTSGKVEPDKSKVEMDELSEAEIESEVDEAMIFSTVDLIANLVSKPYAIVYNSEVKTLLVTCLHFVND